MKIEVCANSFYSAKIAQERGAFRVELCHELRFDGLTPSADLLEEVTTQLTIPVHVLIRPREGDFHYSPYDLSQIEQEIEMAKSYDISGIVVGHLNPDHTLDPVLLAEWRALSHGLELSFHRAFDRVANPIHGLDQIMEAGFNRILTSGQAPSASEGLAKLVQWQKYVGQALQIMPGGGIHHQNAAFFKNKGFEAIHLSAKKMNTKPGDEPIIDPAILEEVLSITKE